ncbi:MAG: hypothetical protein QM756_12800 [Polyangiaceae bacterium]
MKRLGRFARLALVTIGSACGARLSPPSAASGNVGGAGGAASPPAVTRAAQSDATQGGESSDEITSAQVRLLGCSERSVVCVDACSGAVLEAQRDEYEEDDQVVIQIVGRGRCQPQEVYCSSRGVANIDVATPEPARQVAAPGTSDAGVVSSVRQSLEAAGAVGEKASEPDSHVDSLQGAPASRNESAAALRLRTIMSQATRQKPNAADGVNAAAEKYRSAATAFSRLETGLDMVEKGTAVSIELKDRRQTQVQVNQARAELAREVELTARPLVKNVRAAEKRLSKVRPDLGRSELDSARRSVAGYRRVLESVPAVSSAELRSAKERAVASLHTLEIALVPRETAFSQARDVELAAWLERPTRFGSCSLRIPKESQLRELVVDIELRQHDPCRDPQSPTFGRVPWCVPPTAPGVTSTLRDGADGGGDGADGGDSGLSGDTGAGGTSASAGGSGGRPMQKERLDPLVSHSVVHLGIAHGKYYYDVGVLTAIVPEGERKVETLVRPGIPGDNFIHVVSKGALIPALAFNLYPGGHRRGAYSGFAGSRTSRGDLFALQLAVSPDLTHPFSSIFGGVLFEPVTGFAVGGGAVLLQGEFLKSGYADGMSTTATRADYVEQRLMLRGYFAITLGLELINTTARRSAPPAP